MSIIEDKQQNSDSSNPAVSASSNNPYAGNLKNVKTSENKTSENSSENSSKVKKNSMPSLSSMPTFSISSIPSRLLSWAMEIYEHKYEKLLIIPILLLLLAFGIIGTNYFRTGNFIDTDVSLKGGTTLTVFNAPQAAVTDLERALESEFPRSDITVRSLTESGRQRGVIIDSSDIDPAKLAEFTEKELKVTKDDYSIEIIGSTLGQSFFTQAIKAVIYAFVFMAIVIFVIFRSPMPSLYVVLAAFSDIVETWAIMILLGIKLSTAGIAALLMLIGYSVDTDILLTTRVLRRVEGNVFKAVAGALKTGLTMTFASLAAVLVAYFVSSSHTLKQIMLILAIGLVFDIINTWLQNAGLLRLYVKKKEKTERL